MAISDQTKRQNNANNAVIYVRQLLDAMNALEDLATERSQFVNPFADADFTPAGIAHMNAAMIGTLYDFVIGNVTGQASGIAAWFADAGNGGRNKQILEQVR